MGFPDRSKIHDDACKYLVEWLNKECKINAVCMGQEHTPLMKIHSHLRHLYNDPTATFLKHQPDIVFVAFEHAYMVDIKTLSRKYLQGENFSIEKASYETLMKLHQTGCVVIVGWTTILEPPYNFKFCFIHF